METIVNLNDGEIISLMKNGFPFKLTRKVTEKKWWQFWESGNTKDITQTYRMKELPLGVMEKIAKQTDKFSTQFSLLNLGTKNVIQKDLKILCKIIAMAIMGEDLMYLQNNFLGNLEFKIRKKELNSLTKILYENLKPSDIKRLIELVDITHNYGDLINSIMKLRGVKSFYIDEKNALILN